METGSCCWYDTGILSGSTNCCDKCKVSITDECRGRGTELDTTILLIWWWLMMILLLLRVGRSVLVVVGSFTDSHFNSNGLLIWLYNTFRGAFPVFAPIRYPTTDKRLFSLSPVCTIIAKSRIIERKSATMRIITIKLAVMVSHRS